MLKYIQVILISFFHLGIIFFLLGPTYNVNQIDIRALDYITYSCYVFVLFSLVRLVFLALATPLNLFFKKFRSVIFYLLESFLMFFLIADLFMLKEQGLHVYDKVILKTLSNPNFNRELNFGFQTIATFLLLCSIIIALNSFLIPFLLKKINKFTNFKKLIPVTIVYVTLMISSSIWTIFSVIPTKGEVANIYPLYTPLKGVPKQEQLKTSYKFETYKKIENKKDVLFILAESLRSDYLTRERMPKTYSLLHSKGCFISDKMYAGGHTTEYGVFTSLYGLYGHHYSNFQKDNISSHGLKGLRDNDYKLIGGSASQLKSWNNAAFILNIFSPYKEFQSSKVWQDDQTMVQWLLAEIEKEKGPKFIFSFFNSTHHNYFFPDEFKKHTPIMKGDYNHFLDARDLETFKTKILNRYKNSVLYLDDIIVRYINQALASLNDNAIIVISGDHGEEFWEEGLLGHGKTSYINPEVKVPLAVCGVSDIQAQGKIVSHVDIVPTILDELSAGNFNKEAFNGMSLKDPSIRNRKYISVVGSQFPYGRNKMGLISQEYKYWLKRSSKEMHKLYKYRSTDLNDNNILDGSDSNDFQEALKAFSNDAYKFLVR